MKLCVILAGLLVVASTTTALAAGPYVGVGGGVSIYHDSDVSDAYYGSGTAEYDTGYGLNACVGYNFDGARLEGEFGYRSASVKDTSVDANVMSFMANGYYDFKNQSSVTPFIGAGIGLLNGELEESGYSVDDTVFGFQLTVGAGFKVDKNVTIDLYYRYQGAASDFNQDGTDVSYGSSNIFAGLRYNF